MTEDRTDLFTIPLDAWDDFAAKLAKLNKRAAKLGCEPITYTVIEEKDVERETTFKDCDGEWTKRYKVRARIIELHGKAPKVEGFAFIAKIEYLGDGQSMLFHTVPGVETKIDERFRSLRPGVCEHCQKQRRRTETFVVEEIATGKQTQVGRQCLADFTGANRPEDLARRATYFGCFTDLRDEEDRCWRSHFDNSVDTLKALALTSACIGKHGWMSRKAAEVNGRQSTAGMVSELMGPAGNDPDDIRWRREMWAAAREPEHAERARKVVEWIKTDLAGKARSDYELNLVTLVVNDLTQRHHLGIVCSAVSAYQRAINKAIEYAERNRSLAGSKHVGEIGKRLRGVKVEVRFVKILEGGDFGPRTLVKFITADGDVLTWFASADRDFAPGEKMTIAGTVKAHKEYNGIKETQLSRVV